MKACFLAAFGVVCAVGFADEGGLTVARFEKLHKELTSAKEPWQEIPWHVSVLEARSQAAREKKPVYMLCRAGHPLGCV
jgi:hypothetical protein